NRLIKFGELCSPASTAPGHQRCRTSNRSREIHKFVLADGLIRSRVNLRRLIDRYRDIISGRCTRSKSIRVVRCESERYRAANIFRGGYIVRRHKIASNTADGKRSSTRYYTPRT